ncbi:MAG: hypothetical protein V1913_11695 [Fibrobacterota bacterium]
MTRTVVLVFLLTFPGALFCLDLPDGYDRFRFGADTVALVARFPVSDAYKHTLARVYADSARGTAVYRLVRVKGVVDSVLYHFVDNRFAMAVEYRYPGREYFEKTVHEVTGRFGQFVGRGNVFWRRQQGRMVRIGLKPGTVVATVGYMDEALVGRMQDRLGFGASPEEQAIDSELKKLDTELKELDGKKE